MAIEDINNEEDENDFFDYAGDILAAPFRGVEGALQGAYNLADYLAFDILPDYDTRFLGTSKTMAGGAVEGITQFATGFVPLFGLAGRAGALAKAGTATKAVVAGAATDFTFFNGQEARLSNLIQQVPELQNPVTEFLAYDEDEGELEGRMKNVLEGLGLEAVAGPFIAGLKAIKRGRKAKDEGKDAVGQAQAAVEPLEGGNALAFAPELSLTQALKEDTDGPFDRIGKVWESASETEDLFRTKPQEGTTLEGLLNSLNVEGWEVARRAEKETGEQTIEIAKIGKPSHNITVFEKGDEITVDAMQAGRGGQGVYQSILQYAFNKNKVYTPISLTPINQVRVLSAMFSSALKNKSTKHFRISDPLKFRTNNIKQYFVLPDGYKWGEDYQRDLNYLAVAERNIVYDKLSRIADITDTAAYRADTQRKIELEDFKRSLDRGVKYKEAKQTWSNRHDNIELLQEFSRVRNEAISKDVDPDEQLLSYLNAELDKIGTRASEVSDIKPINLDDYEYDFEEDTFYKVDEDGAKEVIDEVGIENLLKKSDPNFAAGVGATTFKRAVVTNTSLSFDPDKIGGRLGERVQLLEGRRGSLERTFPAPEVKGLDAELGKLTPELKKDFYDKTLVEQVASRMQTNNPMTVREALEDLNGRTNGNLGQYTPIVKKLLALGKDTGIDAKLEDRAFASNVPSELREGSFYESGRRRVVFDGRSATLRNNPAYVLLHEGTHAVTVDNVNKFFDAASFNKIDTTDIAGRAKAIDDVLKKDLPKPIAEMFRMFKKADSMRDDIVASGADESLYWIKNPAEFMSMAFSDPRLQEALKGIQYTPKMTMWEKVVNTVKSFFGRGVSKDLADNIVSRVGEIAEMKLPGQRRRSIDFAPELPKLDPKKPNEFLQAIPEKFRGYADELLKGGTPRLPQFALETDGDVVVLKDILEQYYKENPDKVTVDVKDAVTEVDTEIEQTLMLQEGKDAATKIAEARVVQQSLRDQAKAVVGNLTEAVAEYRGAGGGSAAIAKLKNNFQQLLSVADVYRRLGREGGLLLGSRREKYGQRKIGLNQSDSEIEGIRNAFINESGGMHPDKLVARIEEAIDEGNPDSMINSMFKLAKQAQGKHFLDMPTEYWMNAILSGPKTQMVNVMGNSLTQVMATIEATVGGLATGNLSVVKAVLASWSNGKMIGEAAHFAKKAFKQNDNLLDPQSRAFSDRPQGAITGDRIAGGRLSGMVTQRGLTSKKSFDAMGNFIRIPSRLLLTTDEFFKQLAYRRAARLKAAMSGLQQGIKDPKKLAEHIHNTLEGIITEGGRMSSEVGLAREANEIAAKKNLTGAEKDKFILKYIKENFDKSKSALIQYAQDEAQYLTFTRDLQDGTLGKVLQEATNKLPMLRLVLPFVRTPTNLLKYAFERTPGVFLLKEERARLFDDLKSGDSLRQSQAMGKMMTATAVAGVFVDTIYNNREYITGGGPKDPREKQALLATGWKPYSIKIGDTYYSYQRLDPLSTLLGVGADLVEIGVNEPRGFDESGLERFFLALTLSVTRNATNKSYLAGIQNFTDALSDPERYMARFGQNFTSSFVPNIISQMADADTQAVREVRSVGDAFAKKLGFRSGLDKKRNLLGEEYTTEQWMGTGFINPIAMSPVKDDPVFNEMAQLSHAFRQPAPNLGGQVDMLAHENEKGQTAYDRQLELLQTVKVGGVTLRKALTRLINSRAYQAFTPVSEPALPSPRVQKINTILSRFRKEARNQMLEEFPELAKQYQSLMKARAGLKGGMQREDVLELLTQ